MSRRLRSNVPSTRESREPVIPDRQEVVKKDKKQKLNQKYHHDHHHGSRELPDVAPGDKVWISDREEGAHVRRQVAPRSFEVETDNNSVYRRNRRNLVSLLPPQKVQTETAAPTEEQELNEEVVEQPLRRSTRVTAKPDRWDPSSK